MAPTPIKHTVFRVIEETTPGTTPSAGATLLNLGAFPVLAKGRSRSQPTVLDGSFRAYPDQLTQEQGSVTISTPALQYKNCLLLREGLVANDEATPVDIDLSDVSVSSGVVGSVAGDLSAVNDGDIVWIGGAGASPNPAAPTPYGPVTSAGASSFTLPSGGSGNIQDFSSGGAVTIDTTRLVDGSSPKTYSVQRHLTGLTNQYRTMTYGCVSQGSFGWTSGQHASESYEIMGKSPAEAAAVIGTGDTAAPTSAWIRSAAGVNAINIVEAGVSYIVSDLQFQLQMNHAMRYGLVSGLGPAAIVATALTGQLTGTVVYDDTSDSFYNNIEAFDTVSIWWSWSDEQGNQEAILLAATKAAEGDVQGNPDDVAEFPFTLQLHNPAYDASSAYVSSGFGFQVGFFRKDA